MHAWDHWLILSWIQELSDDILQKIAKEMNLSETTFILEKNKHDTYSKGEVLLRQMITTCVVDNIVSLVNKFPSLLGPLSKSFLIFLEFW